MGRQRKFAATEGVDPSYFGSRLVLKFLTSRQPSDNWELNGIPFEAGAENKCCTLLDDDGGGAVKRDFDIPEDYRAMVECPKERSPAFAARQFRRSPPGEIAF